LCLTVSVYELFEHPLYVLGIHGWIDYRDPVNSEKC